MKYSLRSAFIFFFSVFTKLSWCLNPVHPNISIHILNTPLFTFPMSLTRRICLTIKAFNVGDHNSFILMILMKDSAALL